jgi:hypothetical protein
LTGSIIGTSQGFHSLPSLTPARHVPPCSPFDVGERLTDSDVSPTCRNRTGMDLPCPVGISRTVAPLSSRVAVGRSEVGSNLLACLKPHSFPAISSSTTPPEIVFVTGSGNLIWIMQERGTKATNEQRGRQTSGRIILRGSAGVKIALQRRRKEGHAEDTSQRRRIYAVAFGTFHCGRKYKQKDAWNMHDAMWLPCGSP